MFVGHEAMSPEKNSTSCRCFVVREIEHAVSRKGYFHELSLVQREGPHPRSIDAAIVDVATYGGECLLPNVIYAGSAAARLSFSASFIFSLGTRRRFFVKPIFDKVQMIHFVGSKFHAFTPLR